MMTQHNESSAVKLDNEQLMQMAKLISQNIAPVQAKQWEGSHILVNDYMTEWLEAKHGIDIVQKTYENYEGRYRNHIKPFFEGKTIMDVSYNTVSAFVKHLKAKGVTDSTIHDIVRVLSIALNEAVNVRELIPKNPCDGVHLPKIRQKKKRPTITDTEARKLFEVCKGHHYWIAIPILLMCGMRKGELLALTWDDVFQDEDTGQWYISINKKVSASKGKHTVEKFMKTLEGYRNVAVPHVLVDLMFYYKEHTQQNSRTYIIAQKRQDKMESTRNFNRTFTRWKEKAGITKPISPHSCRRAFATRLVLEGVTLEAMKKQGGWKSDKMPYYYADEAQTDILKNKCADIMGQHWAGQFVPVAE